MLSSFGATRGLRFPGITCGIFGTSLSGMLDAPHSHATYPAKALARAPHIALEGPHPLVVGRVTIIIYLTLKKLKFELNYDG